MKFNTQHHHLNILTRAPGDSVDSVEIVLGDSRDQQGEEGREKVGATVRPPVHGSLGDVLHVEHLEVGHQTIIVSPPALDLSGADQETLAPPFQQFEFPEISILFICLNYSTGFQL